MSQMTPILPPLTRPRLLLDAARHGLRDYRRARDLGRIAQLSPAIPPGRALPHLVAAEARQEARRKTGDASYSAPRHVAVLIALLAEAEAHARQSAPDGLSGPDGLT